jgi:hypothetical protein
LKEAQERTEKSNQESKLNFLNVGNISLIKQNWELCLFRITQYQKEKFLNKNEEVSEPDHDMIRWIHKLSQIIAGLSIFPKNSQIISKEDNILLEKLFEVINQK